LYSANPAYSFENDGAEGSGSTAGAAPTAGGEEPVTHVNWRDEMVWCNALTEWYNAQLQPIPASGQQGVGNGRAVQGKRYNQYRAGHDLRYRFFQSRRRALLDAGRFCHWSN